MAKTDPHFRLRISEELKDRVTAAAKKKKHSINAEINFLIEYALDTIERHDALALVPFPDEAAINKALAKSDADMGAASAFGDAAKRHLEAEQQREFTEKAEALIEKLDRFTVIFDPDKIKQHADQSDEIIMKGIAERLGYQLTKK